MNFSDRHKLHLLLALLYGLALAKIFHEIRGGVLPYKRLMGMCRWMGSHFHDWSDYNGVAFSKDLLVWGRKFPDFRGKKGFKKGRFSVKKSESRYKAS